MTWMKSDKITLDMFQIVHWECVTVILYRSNLSGAGLDFFYFLPRAHHGCLHIPQERAIIPDQNLCHAQKRAFHLLILLCKCDSEHVAEINEIVKSRVCVWVVFCWCVFF